ncbi:autotransporter domain-containing protein [Ancylobacter sp.]|uniref:autotransporter outer membrane beta-barrel domain-containing protein n=1 Tax=Ancylobacter sp. TaxID=1872567 RepID=UPI003C7C7BC9
MLHAVEAKTGGIVVATDATTLEFAQAGNYSLSNVISGDGSISKKGAGTLFLTGANTYSGATYVTAGNLQVEGGGSLQSTSGYIANGAGSTAAAVVTGATSSWTGTGEVGVGQDGNGTLTVSAGADVSFAYSYLGSGAAAVGTGTVTGISSSWTSTSTLNVGYAGTGNLTVAAGGTLTGPIGIVGVTAGSTGTVTVTGAGSTWTASQEIGIGQSGTGTLNVEAGGKVNTDTGYMGVNADSKGTATVTGAGSLWTNTSTLNVGYGGTGKLTVEAGGGVTCAAGIVGVTAGSTGTVTVTGAGSTWTASQEIGIGQSGTGTLNVEAGGKVNTDTGFLGVNAGSTGTATVTGAGSSWTNTSQVHVGYGGKGTLTVENAGQVSTGNGYIGSSTGSDGTLDVRTGGSFSSDYSYVGTSVASVGAVTVAGAGSQWTNTHDLVVGGSGTGTLTVSDGGAVSSGNGYIGLNAASSGTVTITGANSSWSTGALDLFVGLGGGGNLTVDKGGSVSATVVTLGYSSGGSGTLELDGEEGGRGVLTAGRVLVGAGSGSLTFDGGVLKASASQADFISSTASVSIKAAGATFDSNGRDIGVSAALSGPGGFDEDGLRNAYADHGQILVQGATLRLTGSEFASASSVEVSPGGILAGNGTVNALIIHGGGILAPGNSPGTIYATDVTFNDLSDYRVDVTPTGEHDLVIGSGTATIDSGATVEVVAVPGKYAVDTKYAILTATGGVTGNFGSVSENYAFLDAALEKDDTNIYLLLHYNGVSFASYARTPNQFTTATAAQTLGSGNAIYDALLMLPENAAPAAFDALSGEAYASVSSVLQQQSIYVRDAVSGRLRQALTAPGVSPLAYGPGPVKAQLAEGYTPTLWAQGYGGWGNSWSNGNAASISNTIGGFLMGADVSVAENARAGLFGGYSRSTFDVDGRSSSGSANNYDLGLYAGAQYGAVALRGGAAYTWHDLSMSRSVVFPGFAESLKGNDTTGTAQVFGEIGYDVEVGAIAFEPFVGLAYVNVSGASLGEEGGAAALSVSTDDMSTFYSTLGVRLATTVEVGGRTLTPYATLGWQHAFGDVTPSSTMQFAGGLTPFSVSGVPVAEDALLLEAGLSYALSANAQIGATYAGQLAGDASQNAFTAQFSLKF